MKRERNPTPEEFAEFLAWLDSDQDEAGRKFNLIHTRLTRIFVSRGCVDAEYLGDEVVNRVAVRIAEVRKAYSDPLRCCVGFAENVHREYLREQRKTVTAKAPPPPRRSEDLEREDACFSHCINELPKSESGLFTSYFLGKGRARINARKKLAEDLSLTPNALRIRAHHLRKTLRQCLELCLGQT